MGWRLIVQPNKLIARFSEVVDDFTHYDMTDEEAIKVCMEEYNMHEKDARDKLSRAYENPDRFKEALSCIKFVHGVDRATEAESECSFQP